MGVKSVVFSSELEFLPLIPLLNLKKLIIPGVSEYSQSDVKAIDIVISSLGLVRAGLFSSPHVTPMIQPGMLTAMELYGSAEGIWVIQIRSLVLNKKKLAEEICEFASKFDHLIVIGTVSPHLEARGVRTMLPDETVSMGGMLKHFTRGVRVVEFGESEGEELAAECQVLLN